MSDYTDKFTIAISAPPGALGEHLAALIEYFTTHDSSVNLHAQNPFARTSQTFFDDLEYLYTQQDTETSFAEFVNSWSGETPTEPEIRVIASGLTPSELSTLFPNSKIINIVTTPQDANQLGFNYLVKESALSGKISPALSKHKSKAEQLFEPAGMSIDWDAVVRDPMVLDQAPVQYVIKALGLGHCARTVDTAVCSNPVLAVNFSALGDVSLRNHAANNASAIAEIYEFVGVQATQDLEVVQNIWVDFMNSFTPYSDIG